MSGLLVGGQSPLRNMEELYDDTLSACQRLLPMASVATMQRGNWELVDGLE